MSSVVQFSQASLQDYADCPRRYQLRYLLMQPWPGLLSATPEESETHLQRGAAFHHLMHQRYAGVALDELAATAAVDPVLCRWWNTHLLHPPPELPSPFVRSEVVLSAPIADHRLTARFDLLAVEPGIRAVVVDWKTSRKRPSRLDLALRLQTRVYRYLLVRAMPHATGQPPLEPEETEMLYWFCQFSGATERFPYDREQYAADDVSLTALVAEIAGRWEPTWPKTPHEERCSFCSYRSLCDRGASPAFDADEADGDLSEQEIDIDVEQIAEVVF